MATTMTVNQLVVGSIPTAGAKNLNKINDLLDFWRHPSVEQKVIKCYKVFLADLARISADFGTVVSNRFLKIQ